MHGEDEDALNHSEMQALPGNARQWLIDAVPAPLNDHSQNAANNRAAQHFARGVLMLHAEVERLRARQAELLALVANISQTVPLESEVAEALNQRGALLAEVGTLRSELADLRTALEVTDNSRNRNAARLATVEHERDAYRAMLVDLVGVHDEHGESHSGYWEAARELLKHGPGGKEHGDGE